MYPSLRVEIHISCFLSKFLHSRNIRKCPFYLYIPASLFHILCHNINFFFRIKFPCGRYHTGIFVAEFVLNIWKDITENCYLSSIITWNHKWLNWNIKYKFWTANKSNCSLLNWNWCNISTFDRAVNQETLTCGRVEFGADATPTGSRWSSNNYITRCHWQLGLVAVGVRCRQSSVRGAVTVRVPVAVGDKIP